MEQERKLNLFGVIKMTITIIVNKTFPTKCEISSIIALSQENYCGKNFMAFTIEDIKEIVKVYNEYKGGNQHG